MTNVLFIDVDGTLITTKDGKQYLPPSAVDAMRQIRARGGLIYLCTGRSLAEARTIGEVPIDGIIGAAGGFVLDGNTMISHKTLGEDAVRELEELLRSLGATYYLECNDGLYFDDACLAYVREAWGIDEDGGWAAIAHTLDDVSRDQVNKVSYRFLGSAKEDPVPGLLAKRFYVVPLTFGEPNVLGGEISNSGINKATAIDELLAHLDLGEVRTFGFGDSMNDVEMLRRCDEAIVMGDARHDVRGYATFVTKGVAEDGLAHAMRHFALID